MTVNSTPNQLGARIT